MKTTITGQDALEKLIEILEAGRKSLSCKKCNYNELALLTNYKGITLVDFSTVCQKCNEITNYELIKTYDKGL
mgnify:CR=1 FL=1